MPEPDSPAARLEARLPSLLSAAGQKGATAATRPGPAFIEKHGDALKRLQRGLTGDRKFAGAGYMDEPESLAAYFLYYWPVSYMQVSMAIEEIRSRKPELRLSRVLDIGSGPGPASAALIDSQSTAVLCTLVDSSAAALSVGAKLLGAAAETTVRFDLESESEFPAGPFDCIAACHSINELWSASPGKTDRRAELLSRAWNRLSPGGVLLVVEPAALATSRPALELRDRLLETLPDVAMLAPCTTYSPCPVLRSGSGRSCHSEWAWRAPEFVAALAMRAGLDRDSIKTTWFALEKSPRRFESSRYRVVSDPMLNKAGRVRYVLCSASGLSTFSAKRDDPSAEAQGFFDLLRGDLIAPAKLEKREGASSWGFTPSSTLGSIVKAPKCDGTAPAKRDRGKGGR